MRRARRFIRGASALMLAAVLAGCGSSGGQQAGGWDALAGLVREGAIAGRQPAAAPMTGLPAITPEQVATAGVPLLLVTVEQRGIGTALALINTNAGTATYATRDLTTVTLRDGVLIATRGLGADVMSAQAPAAARIAAAQGTHRRSYQFLADDDRTLTQDFVCTLRPIGGETPVIAGRSWPSRVVAESCEGATGRFENRYWIDRSGKIRQSRQWAGTVAGMLHIGDPGG